MPCRAVLPWGGLLLGAVLFFAEPAGAFCKATTCNAAAMQSCPVDPQGCATTGEPLSWPRRCVSFGVDQDGSARRGISYPVFDAIVQIAFRQWLAVDCGGGTHPSISLWDMGETVGPTDCKTPQYNQTGPNANAWILRDSDWPYTDPGSQFAHTTWTFDLATGHLLDADVEINAFGVDLTTSDDAIDEDLQSIVTHEAGHFLGLANSSVGDATMSATYSPKSRSARSLSADDMSAICALYPPDRAAPACDDPTPPHGYSRYCAGAPRTVGCAIATRGGPSNDALALAAIGVALFAARRARRGVPR